MNQLKFVACTLAATAMLCSAALAQQDGRQGRQDQQARPGQAMQQMTADQAKVIWTWQAKDVANSLNLTVEQTPKLVEIYTTSRTEFQAAVEQARREARQARQADRDQQQRGGDGAARGQRGQGQGQAGAGAMAMRFDPELVAKHRDGLKTKLNELLGKEPAEKALVSLGTFDAQWDRMVHTLVELKVLEEQMYSALKPIREYSVALVSMRESADREAMRENFMAAREKLMSDLGKVLSEEQIAAFQPRGRGGAQPQRRGNPDIAANEPAPAPQPAAIAEVGKPAPTFTLTDASGKQHTLSDYLGKTVVLQWINPDCPVCVRVFRDGLVKSMRDEIYKIDKDIVHLTINTTHYMEAETSAAYLKSYNIEVPALIDRDGKVGRIYAAQTTPQMYVIDARGVLRYNGAIDDDQRGRNDNRTNFVVQTIRQLAAGETVSPDTTRPYGCTVKYAPGN